MKKVRLFASLAAIFILNSASMCSSDNEDESSTDFTPIINTVSRGTWTVASYIDSGRDETSHFTGYNFEFNSTNNQLIATNLASTIVGSWSLTTNESIDDDATNDINFNIVFTAPSDFASLTEDWNILSTTNTTIQLISAHGGGNGADYLSFQKN